MLLGASSDNISLVRCSGLYILLLLWNPPSSRLRPKSYYIWKKNCRVENQNMADGYGLYLALDFPRCQKPS
jgi:hypothetical protein